MEQVIGHGTGERIGKGGENEKEPEKLRPFSGICISGCWGWGREPLIAPAYFCLHEYYSPPNHSPNQQTKSMSTGSRCGGVGVCYQKKARTGRVREKGSEIGLCLLLDATSIGGGFPYGCNLHSIYVQLMPLTKGVSGVPYLLPLARSCFQTVLPTPGTHTT